jgi:hypothetical protein
VKWQAGVSNTFHRSVLDAYLAGQVSARCNAAIPGTAARAVNRDFRQRGLPQPSRSRSAPRLAGPAAPLARLAASDRNSEQRAKVRPMSRPASRAW